jgi:hypothetical protein
MGNRIGLLCAAAVITADKPAAPAKTASIASAARP